VADQNKNIYSLDEIQRILGVASGCSARSGHAAWTIRLPARPSFLHLPAIFETDLVPADALVSFWEALQEASTLNAIHEFSTINANLTEPKVGDGQFRCR
jgi:hypothetical protein